MLAKQALHALQFPVANAWLGAAAPCVCTASRAFGSQQQESAGSYEDSFRSKPQSLQFARGGVQYPQQLEGNILGRAFLTAIGAYSRRQQLRNGASVLYRAITEAAERPELHQALGLDGSKFTSSHSLLSLHMWLVIRRLAEEGTPPPKDAKVFNQVLYADYFFKDVERRVYAYGVTIHVSKWMKRLEQVFFGGCEAYDAAMQQPEAQQAAALAGALLRNVYEDDQTQRPWALLLARYLIREAQCLSKTDAEAIYTGQLRFSSDIKVTKR
ncbi:ubiquinol-cytochrome C chaperone-domain-containing protein [Scenedesmus sp. NREL 46B-D3]|nr:ubiquinol-cytochrome C chaperone-domain-containing protein [Scenedesmus sp. NREL 46B-D3]